MPIRPFGDATAWRAAALLGLMSSTFSTLVSQVTAARIGRDAAVDWMVVAAIPLRDAALSSEPTWPVVAAGILFHQWADFSWALVFFGLLGRWTAGLSPVTLLVLCGPWALLTSSLEWFVLVPLLPFRQPIFTLEQPYWIGFLVHLTSASLYPLFPWLRDRVAGRVPSSHRRFAALWGGLAAAGVSALGGLALLGWLGWEVPHLGDEAFDQGYLRRMTEHHAQGAQLAALAVERAEDPQLRALAAHDPPETTMFYTGLVGSVLTAPALPFLWETPTETSTWIGIASVGFFGALGHWLLILAHRRAPASTLAPFAYAHLLWAVLLGFLIFGHLPDYWTVIGGAVVAASGLYLLYHERPRITPPGEERAV